MGRDYYDLFEYDAALSFAAADRTAAEELGRSLSALALTVFYDEYSNGSPTEDEMVNHFVNLYARKARYCLVLISQHYPLRRWTEVERVSSRERAFRDPDAYILFLRLDDTEVSGLAETPMDLRRQSMEKIAASLEEQWKRSKQRPGPPAKSHDLRSGNVPATEPKGDRE